ncbi:MAG: PQQ-dependent sugar dehydrogenase [Planctomycetaceae bacterium]|nr:PQQ-dependent sugar dehydrogenase [Planctomycetaceae bacterium]
MTRKLIATAFLWCLTGVALFAADDLPRSLDPRVEIMQFADSTQIVHPVSVDFDRRGRLLVIESHTHFRPAGYTGPEHDRIRMAEDTNGDGRADRFTTFFEGTKATMDLAVHRDGSVYVATRNEILRLRDTNDDGIADDQKRIVFLYTAGNYPHNGLSGLTFDADGNLYFGMGENLGASYKLIGSIGDTEIEDQGEGGNVFWCTHDGEQLRRIATGFWNPFGMNLDPAGRLWCVDNDPDAAPPCRLLQVIEGGDYGYQFRYGRSGRHPFQAWNGQLPGTLPMVAGTGEAPCEVLNYQGTGLPADYQGELLVTSWADHRVERYTLRPSGASYVADRKPFIQGGNDFRPVGLAVAPDGSLFISDWVRRDYNLHGQGGLWHIKLRADQPRPTSKPDNKIHPAAEQLAALAKSTQPLDRTKLLELFNDQDPFVRAVAVKHASQSPTLTIELASTPDLTPRQRCEVLLAQRAAGKTDMVARWLTDDDEEVRFLAVKWIADLKLQDGRAMIESMLEVGNLSVRMYQGCATALARLDGQEVSEAKMAEHFVKLVANEASPAAQRIAALRLIPATHKQLTLDLLDRLLKSNDASLSLEAIRTLAEHADPRKFARLQQIATDANRDVPQRAEAIVGLSSAEPVPVELLMSLALGDQPTLRAEAVRALVGAKLTAEQLQQLQQLKPASDVEAALMARVVGNSSSAARPAANQTAEWLAKLVGDADPAVGRRVFFHAKLAGCYRCHRVEGHGQDVGPDLGLIGRTERRHVLESILQPSTLVAPHYQVWQLVMHDGRTFTGMLLHTQLDEYTYLDPQGNRFKVRTIDIVETVPSQQSIMPNDLVAKLTDQELRDVLAYLATLK